MRLLTAVSLVRVQQGEPKKKPGFTWLFCLYAAWRIIIGFGALAIFWQLCARVLICRQNLVDVCKTIKHPYGYNHTDAPSHEFFSQKFLHNFTELTDGATLACIIFKHLIEFPFIITGDSVRQNMDDITGLGHIVAGRFYASRGICSGDKKLGDIVCLDKGGKFFTC